MELTDEFSSEPRQYGNVSLSENEVKVLSLPPKFGMYRKIDQVQCKIDVEESLNKLRWNRIIQEGESETDVTEVQEFVDVGTD